MDNTTKSQLSLVVNLSATKQREKKLFHLNCD